MDTEREKSHPARTVCGSDPAVGSTALSLSRFLKDQCRLSTHRLVGYIGDKKLVEAMSAAA